MSMELVFVPDAKLKRKSVPVEPSEFGVKLETHMLNMHSLMVQLRGIGLAGVQVGDLRRLLVVDVNNDPIYMVNPEIIDKSDFMTTFEEGCLSIPGARITVQRPEEISVRYHTPLGEVVERTFEDTEAVAVQHEIDHLDGITILEKVSRLKRDIYLRKLKKIKRKIKQSLKGSGNLYY